MTAKTLFLLAAAMTIALPHAEAKQATPAKKPLGLQVGKSGMFLRNGKPFRGIGVNCFNAFIRTLNNPDDTSYRQSFAILARHQIPFVRFAAIGYWPKDCVLYTQDKEQYFRRLDGIVKAAEEQKIGLIPSFFWHPATVSDLVGEPLDQWGNPKSKTHAFMRQYVREIVTRYKDSPAIWAWEFGNEFNLPADLPNASEHRPPVVPELGTATSRSARDEVTHRIIRTAILEFAKEVRKYDKERALISGNAMPRPSAWHQHAERSWKRDTPAQQAEMIQDDNPDPINTLGIHFYPENVRDFAPKATSAQVIGFWMKTARESAKPLFVGEFGAGDEIGPEQARAEFQSLLSAIIANKVELAALWVFDYPGQDGTCNITETNSRAYQILEIEKRNREFKRQGLQ